MAKPSKNLKYFYTHLMARCHRGLNPNRWDWSVSLLAIFIVAAWMAKHGEYVGRPEQTLPKAAGTIFAGNTVLILAIGLVVMLVQIVAAQKAKQQMVRALVLGINIWAFVHVFAGFQGMLGIRALEQRRDIYQACLGDGNVPEGMVYLEQNRPNGRCERAVKRGLSQLKTFDEGIQARIMEAYIQSAGVRKPLKELRGAGPRQPASVSPQSERRHPGGHF